MTALAEITAALGKLPKPKRGHGRIILVGISAERSIQCELPNFKTTRDSIAGFNVLPTFAFEGWAIRDVDAQGRWHDCRP